MSKKISSTKLKQETSWILNDIAQSGENYVVYTYNRPRAVIVDYKEWQMLKAGQQQSEQAPNQKRLETLKKLQFKGPKINSTDIIRNWRDEEGE